MVIDWSGWPVLEVRAAHLPADEARDETWRALEEALARTGTFAVVVEMPSPAGGRRVRGAVEQVRMIKRLRPGLSERCRGLAAVLPEEAQREHAKVIRSGTKIWGCPTTAVHTLDEGRVWARGQLRTGVPDPGARPSASEDPQGPPAR